MLPGTLPYLLGGRQIFVEHDYNLNYYMVTNHTLAKRGNQCRPEESQNLRYSVGQLLLSLTQYCGNGSTANPKRGSRPCRKLFVKFFGTKWLETWGRQAKMNKPWLTEPDQGEFHHAGFPCILLRNTEVTGAWCGYVGVPPGHPAHGKPYEDVNVEVHGGLTYAEPCQGRVCHKSAPGESDDIWWLGFDCSHCDDLMPLLDHGQRSMGRTYRDMAYVREETQRLADQLAAMDNTPGGAA